MDPFNQDALEDLKRPAVQMLRNIARYEHIKVPPIPRCSADDEPMHPAGMLDRLPVELLHNIFERLDLLSLHNVLYTNKRGKALVESLPAYRDIVTYATSAIAVLKRQGTIAHFSTAKIHKALRSTGCHICGRFGPVLCLFTCERCCLTCLYEEPSLAVMVVERAMLFAGLDRKDMSKLPLINPGPWLSPSEFYLDQTWVSGGHVVAASEAKYGSPPTRRWNSPRVDAIRIFCEWRVNVAPRYRDRRICFPPELPSAASVIVSEMDRRRSLTAVQMPALSPSRQVEHGTWCDGCRYSCDCSPYGGRLHAFGHYCRLDKNSACSRLRLQGIAYSRAEFAEHVRSCPGVWKMKKLESGNRQPARE